MSTNLFVTLTNNVKTLVQAISASVGAGDANKIVATGADGRIDSTLLPTGLGADSKVVVASEALSAGDFVNIHDVAGAANVRKASAVDATKPAHGFVANNFASAASATVFFEGSNSAVSGRTAGVQYVLSNVTPGGSVAIGSFVPATGNIVQTLGVATSATEINAEIDGSYVVIG